METTDNSVYATKTKLNAEFREAVSSGSSKETFAIKTSAFATAVASECRKICQKRPSQSGAEAWDVAARRNLSWEVRGSGSCHSVCS